MPQVLARYAVIYHDTNTSPCMFDWSHKDVEDVDTVSHVDKLPLLTFKLFFNLKFLI